MSYPQNCVENYVNLQRFDEIISFTELTIILIIYICVILPFVLCHCFETTIMKICFTNFGDITVLTNSKMQETLQNSIYFHIKFRRRLASSISMVPRRLRDLSECFWIRNIVEYLIILLNRFFGCFLIKQYPDQTTIFVFFVRLNLKNHLFGIPISTCLVYTV